MLSIERWCQGRNCLFVAVVFCVLLIIEGEVWNVKAEVKAMNLRTGSGCFGGYRWNSSTQGELVTSSDHVHYSCIPSVSDSYSSFTWGTKLLPQNIDFSKHTISRGFFAPTCSKKRPKPPRATYKQSPPADEFPLFSRVKAGRSGGIFKQLLCKTA